MNFKTPASVLLEFCAQQKVAPPVYESVSSETEPGVFMILVKAFDLIGKGTGRTKKDAKHAASQQLLGKCKVQFHSQFFFCCWLNESIGKVLNVYGCYLCEMSSKKMIFVLQFSCLLLQFYVHIVL